MSKGPTIEIDRLAVRFTIGDETTNLFWRDLFTGNGMFMQDVMDCLQLAYEECIREDILPEVEA